MWYACMTDRDNAAGWVRKVLGTVGIAQTQMFADLLVTACYTCSFMWNTCMRDAPALNRLLTVLGTVGIAQTHNYCSILCNLGKMQSICNERTVKGLEHQSFVTVSFSIWTEVTFYQQNYVCAGEYQGEYGWCVVSVSERIWVVCITWLIENWTDTQIAEAWRLSFIL